MTSKITAYRSLLDQRQYLKMMAANVVSRFGDSLDAIAFSWIMYEVTGSASLMALILALNYLPSILLQPFAGVWVERLSKKKVMIFCDWGRAFLVAVTAALMLTQSLNAVVLVIITLLNSTLESFRIPAGSAIVPMILEKEKYSVGTALNQTVSRIFELIGTGVAGGIIALLGSHTALLIDAGTFLFSAVVIRFIRYTESIPDGKRNAWQYLQNLKDGFVYLKQKRILFFLVLLGAFINFSAVPLNAFLTPYVADVLSQGPETLSILSISLTLGMGGGAFLTPKLQKRISSRCLIIINILLLALFYISLWAIPFLELIWIVPASGTAFLMVGISIGQLNVILSASFMDNIPLEYMARLSAISNATMIAMMPIGSFICSVLVSFLPITAILLFVGLFSGATGIAAIFIKEYREL